ncbi:hypothetical protein EZS27_036344, partial [termite gut metagenome]
MKLGTYKPIVNRVFFDEQDI